MSELALKLIRENIEKHRRGEDATFLDLGNCGMTEVPEEIGECVWVEELVLSNTWLDYNNNTGKINESQNTGKSNCIISIAVLKKLTWLKN